MSSILKQLLGVFHSSYLNQLSITSYASLQRIPFLSFVVCISVFQTFPHSSTSFWWLSGKESADVGTIGDAGLIPRSRRSPGGGNGNPTQYSCLRNPMDRGAWQSTAHGIAKQLDTIQQLNTDKHLLLNCELHFKEHNGKLQ